MKKLVWFCGRCGRRNPLRAARCRRCRVASPLPRRIDSALLWAGALR